MVQGAGMHCKSGVEKVVGSGVNWLDSEISREAPARAGRQRGHLWMMVSRILER